MEGSRECLATPTQRALREPTKEKTLTASSVVRNYRVARVYRGGGGGGGTCGHVLYIYILYIYNNNKNNNNIGTYA